MTDAQIKVMKLIGSKEHWPKVTDEKDTNLMFYIGVDCYLGKQEIQPIQLNQFIGLADKFRESAGIPSELIAEMENEALNK